MHAVYNKCFVLKILMWCTQISSYDKKIIVVFNFRSIL